MEQTPVGQCCPDNVYTECHTLSFQITVYLGKRDFIDHLTHIDPIGRLLKVGYNVHVYKHTVNSLMFARDLFGEFRDHL